MYFTECELEVDELICYQQAMLALQYSVAMYMINDLSHCLPPWIRLTHTSCR